MPLPSSADSQYLYSTVQIEGNTADLQFISGTGFYFEFHSTEEREYIGIVTNKHVLENLADIRILFILADENGVPDDRNPLEVNVPDIQSKIVFHPDDDVDLCTIPLGYLEDYIQPPAGKSPIIHALSPKDFLTTEELEEISAVENVIMISYPNGIMDMINNKPVVRKGITATHYLLDYDGQRDFLIDMMCFGGSSGAPIFLTKYGVFGDEGHTMIGNRIRLIGILYKGLDTDQYGTIIRTNINIPLATRVSIHLNLGIAMRAERLEELGDVLLELNRKQQTKNAE